MKSLDGPDMYYENKLVALQRIFGSKDLSLEGTVLRVAGRRYPIIDDVIVLLDTSQYTPYVISRLGAVPAGGDARPSFAEDIQFTFGAEWQKFGQVMFEHKEEFEQYFDLVDDNLLSGCVCDLGCGIGRWSYFIADKCREAVLIDFSDAIFVARRNLKNADNALFFMADLTSLPFASGFADFIFCLGVLHHLPVPALEQVRKLGKYADSLLIYLYYALDNRPWYFRMLLPPITVARSLLSRIRSHMFRSLFSWLGAVLIYRPLVLVGGLCKKLGINMHIPLAEGYAGKGIERIRQDVYDRFFTRIEQRVSKSEIMKLRDTYRTITVSDNIPYWHFLCKK